MRQSTFQPHGDTGSLIGSGGGRIGGAPLSFQEQAAMLKELGYEGVGHIWLDKIEERLKTLDEAGLKLFQITMTVNLTVGKAAFDARFKDVLARVKGRQVQFCLLVSGAKPSDAAADPVRHG